MTGHKDKSINQSMNGSQDPNKQSMLPVRRPATATYLL